MNTALQSSLHAGAGQERIDQFFYLPAALADRWRELTAVARTAAGGALPPPI